MADEEIITLDSDDEDTPVPNLLSNGNNAGISIKRIPTAPRVIPRGPRGGGHSGMGPGRPGGLPLPPGMSANGPIPKKSQVPRKPGVFPPFALFSQEQRPQILQEQPSISFGDIGRKLGEMWHALSEAEKEEYRRRAREISDQKMAEYQNHLAKMPAQQRQLAIQASNTPAKKRKTHGYAIFSAEMRKNLGSAMSPQETANVIAESWRSASPDVRRDYEERAARINAAQARKMAQYQPQMANQAQNNPNPNRFNNASGSGLRISSVSSLSPQAKRNPAMMNQRVLPPPQSAQGAALGPKLPSGITISRGSGLGPKLPSGITMSRVEPDIAIVDDTPNYAPIAPKPMHMQQNIASRGHPGVMNSRGRGPGRPPVGGRPVMSPAAQAAMRVKAQLRAQNQQQQQPWGNSVPRGGYTNSRGRGRGMGPGPYSQKRPAPTGPSGMAMAAKKMRPMMSSNLLEQKLCRSCGFINPVGCKLADRTDILQSLSELTNTPIDLIKDQMEGYPAEICRRCLSTVNNFTVFKKTFEEGQVKLKTQFSQQQQQQQMLPLPDSIAAENDTTGISNDQEESILPDLDCEVDFGENPANIPQPVDIKKEKVRLITPSALGQISIKTEMGKSMDSENIVQDGQQETVAHKTEPEEPTEDKEDAKKPSEATEEETNAGEEVIKPKPGPDDPLTFNDIAEDTEEKHDASNKSDDEDNIVQKEAPDQDNDKTSVNGLDSSKNGETNEDKHKESENTAPTGKGDENVKKQSDDPLNFNEELSEEDSENITKQHNNENEDITENTEAENDDNVAEKDNNIAENDDNIAENDDNIAENDDNVVENEGNIEENDDNIEGNDDNIEENDDTNAEEEKNSPEHNDDNNEDITENEGNTAESETNIVEDEEENSQISTNGLESKESCNGFEPEIGDDDDDEMEIPGYSLEGEHEDSFEISPEMSDVDQTPQEPENDTLEDDSNMADDENSTTILNNEESNLEENESNAPDITREESFVSCATEDEGDQTMTNASTEDPFESFAGDPADTDDNIPIHNENEGMEGSQDANDAFEAEESVEKESDAQEEDEEFLNDEQQIASNEEDMTPVSD